MYKRHIDVKGNLVYINEWESVSIDLSELPNDIAFYVETEDDWWFERDPFDDREKLENIRPIALNILEEAISEWEKERKLNFIRK